MLIATKCYEKYLNSNGIRRIMWSLIKKMLIKILNDPICVLPIHGKHLKIPLSHQLPEYIKKFPFYDRLPQRLSKYLHQKHGYLICVDVGANIGDTIAAFYQKDTDIFLAIEPHPKFRKLLEENWGGYKNIIIVSDICSSSSGEDQFEIQSKNGTASILEVNDGILMKKRPLDEIINDYPLVHNPNVIKIDTDGHDFEVIKGAKNTISKNLPVILFECDIFENENFVEEVLDTLNFFKECGYNYFIVYDNFGALMGRFPLSNLYTFKNLLFYKLISTTFYYFDILVIPDDDLIEFYKMEIDYFIENINNETLKNTAVIAVENIVM
jgi:FkbM family methyltransferase